jgi:hypothetical protein
MSAGLLCGLLLVERRWRPGLSRGYWVPLGVLLGLWVALDYGCRLLAWLMGAEAFTVFTPSRFLTNAVPLLAVLAGWGVVRLMEGWGSRKRWVVGTVGGVVVMAAMLPRYAELWGSHPVPAEWIEAGRWVSANAPAEVLVLNGPTVHPGAREWLSYLTRRATTFTPIPTSELLARIPSREEKLAAAGEIWDLRERRWVNPGVHEVLYVAGEGLDAVAVCRVRRER